MRRHAALRGVYGFEGEQPEPERYLSQFDGYSFCLEERLSIDLPLHPSLCCIESHRVMMHFTWVSADPRKRRFDQIRESRFLISEARNQ